MVYLRTLLSISNSETVKEVQYKSKVLFTEREGTAWYSAGQRKEIPQQKFRSIGPNFSSGNVFKVKVSINYSLGKCFVVKISNQSLLGKCL
jgi:hypothetical protein